MRFRNLQIFQLDHDWVLPAGTLEQRLLQHPLQACPAMSPSSSGWVPPFHDVALVHSYERHLIVALGTELKLLPASVVNDAAKAKAVEFERVRGFKAGRKQLRDLKDQVTAELLPRAFVKRQQTLAWIDPVHRRIIVDAASPARAEALVEQLRRSLDELKVSLPQPKTSPAAVMTGWLAQGAAGGPFELGDACELTGQEENRPLVRYLRHTLEDPQLKRQLEQGFRVTKLALIWKTRLSLTIDERLQIKKLAFMESQAEDAASQPNADEQIQADLALMTGELARLLTDLFTLFEVSIPA